MDYINDIKKLKEHIKENELERGDLGSQEEWHCSVCNDSLSNGDLMLEYNSGWGRTAYVCEKCWDKAFEEKEQ